VKAIQIQKKQVQQVKATNNISFVEARRKVESEAASHRPTIAAIISRPVSACTSLKHNVQTQTIISWLRHQAHQLKHLMLSHKQKQKHPLDRIGRTGSAPSAQIPSSHHHILLTEGATNLLLVKIKITTNPKPQNLTALLLTHKIQWLCITGTEYWMRRQGTWILNPPLPKMSNIIQWNIRDLQANREELSTLLSVADPVAVSLQEILIKASRTINFSNYLYLDIPVEEVNGTAHRGGSWLVAWHRGRTSVSGRRTFPVLRSTCS